MRPPKHLYRHLLILCSLLLIIAPCLSQLPTTTFENFTQPIFNSASITPACPDTTHQSQLLFNHVNELGLFSNVNRFYLDAHSEIPSNGSPQRHFAGMQLEHLSIGDYINRIAFQVRYALMIPLSPKAQLCSGISLGAINFSLQTTQGGTGGADTGLDGALGLRYVRPHTSIGLSVQQLFANRLTPIDQPYQLHRAWNVDLVKYFSITPHIDLTLYATVQLKEQELQAFNMGLFTSIKHFGIVGISNFRFEKTSAAAGIQNIEFHDFYLKFIASYSFYHSSPSLPDNALELLIAIQK